MVRRTLLCVDDDATIRELYRMLLGSCGYDVVVAENGAHALKLFRPHEIDAVVLDFEMPGMNGSQLAAEIKRRSPEVPVVMVSGCPSLLEGAPRFVDAALAKGLPIGRLLDKLDVLMGAAKSRMRPAMRISSFVPLASALASVAAGVFVALRYWK